MFGIEDGLPIFFWRISLKSHYYHDQIKALGNGCTRAGVYNTFQFDKSNMCSMFKVLAACICKLISILILVQDNLFSFEIGYFNTVNRDDFGNWTARLQIHIFLYELLDQSWQNVNKHHSVSIVRTDFVIRSLSWRKSSAPVNFAVKVTPVRNLENTMEPTEQ